MTIREPYQAVRLGRFREKHPDVIIGDLGFGGTWQAIWKTGGTEMVVTRHLLRELLDKLDEFFDGDPDG